MASPTVHTTILSRVWNVIKASRIPAWSFGPILYGIGIMHSRVIPKSPAPLLRAGLQVVSFTLPLCIIVFGVNDVYDYESDRRNPRKVADGLEGGILHPQYHGDVLKAAYFSTIVIILSALATQRRDNIIATVLLVLLGWQYSSPPLRLKEIPVLDSLSNGCIVFLAWFCGFSFSGLSVPDVPAKGLMLSLCTMGIHALGAAMDMEADISSGQTTIAVALGKRGAAMFAAMCYFIASRTVDLRSIFGIYVWTGLAITTIPCLNVNWAHRSFQAIVYVSITIAVFWIGSRARSVLRGVKLE